MVHEKSRLRGFQKTYVGRLFSGYLKYPLSWGFLRVLGAWMTFKKADMAKTLKTRFSMIETNPLNHKWLDFVIFGIAPVSNKLAVKCTSVFGAMGVQN